MHDISVVESWLEAANMPTIMDFSPATNECAFVMFARPLTEAELSALRAFNLDVWDLGGLCSYRLQFVPSVGEEDDWREFDTEIERIAAELAEAHDQPKPCPYCGAAPDTCNCVELLFGDED